VYSVVCDTKFRKIKEIQFIFMYQNKNEDISMFFLVRFFKLDSNIKEKKLNEKEKLNH
jgi:hypothetical protein